MATQILGKVAYTSRGAYDSSFSYEINDVVTYKGSSYVSKKETKGNLPTNEEYWMLLAEKGATYQVTEEDLKNIANEITADANSAFNQNVNSKTDAFNSNATAATNTFNDNASAKTNAYNTNATSKLNAYNSNASSKLEAYNQNHDEKVEAYNTNANTKLEEFNTNASSYDERITDNTNRVKRIENTLYDSGEASGSSINIKDSTLAEFQEISVDGVCKQTTTTGKSLFDFNNNYDSKFVDTLTFENEILTLKSVGGTYKYTTTNITNLIKDNPGKTLKFIEESYSVVELSLKTMVQLSVTYSDGTAKLYRALRNYSTNASSSYDIPSDTSIIEQVNFGFYVNNTDIDLANTLTLVKPMLYFDNGDDTYEPFTGGVASPSPSYPQPIEVIDEGFEVVSCGKQLVKFENQTRTSNDVTTIVENETINASGVVTANWTNLTTGEKTKANLQKGKKYTMVLNQPAPYNFYAKNGEQYITIYKGQKTTSFTQKDEYKSIYFFIAELTSGTEISINDLKVMIYEGEYDTTRNDFEPYQETRVPINLPDGEFVGKINENAKDQVRIAFNEDDGKYHAYLDKKIGKVILDGSESWDLPNNQNSNGNYKTSYFTTSLPDIKPDSKMLSNYFAFKYLWNNDVVGIWVGGSKFLNIRISKTIANTTASFKEWLSENNVEAYYELSEPYEVDLGIVDMPLSYSKETNLFITHWLEAIINGKYYRNFEETIRNLQVNEKALKEELIDINSRLSALETNLVNMANVQEVENQENESEVI